MRSDKIFWGSDKGDFLSIPFSVTSGDEQGCWGTELTVVCCISSMNFQLN